MWNGLDIKKGLSLYDLVSTVCHEMVHVKQYVKGQLLHRSDGSQMWKKDPSIREGKTKYENTPWEAEAFGLEDELAKECFEQINFNLETWKKKHHTHLTEPAKFNSVILVELVADSAVKLGI